MFQGDFENVRDMLRDFYTATAPDAQASITEYFSRESMTGKWTIKVYNLSDAKPRYPVYTDTDTLTLPATSNLPTEVAAVMSFQGVRIAGEKQSKRRNRVYLGPWAVTANYSGYVTDSLVETILFSGKELIKASEASDQWDWVIYSPTDNEVIAIENGWVDNGWDTQRRRGTRATARGTFSNSTPT
jgi:hypothetical protein